MGITIKDVALTLGISYATVRTDNENIMRVIMDHLLKLQHKDIVYLGGNENISGITTRINTYSRIMDEHHLKKVILTSPLSMTRESGRSEGLKLLKIQPLPTAVIAANDNVALGLMEVLDEKGIRIPEDISVVGTDNIEIASLNRISLTTVDQPKYEIGVLAIKILINRVLNIPDNYPFQNAMPISFIERNSTQVNKR